MRGLGPIDTEELLANLEQMEAWLADLGFAKHDRLHQSVANVREFTKVREKLRSAGAPYKEIGIRRFVDYVYAFSEVLEFVQIWQVFGRDTPEVLKPKLSRALSGPLLRVRETTENADARNVTFELALAAEWCKYGLDAAIGEPDIALSIQGIRFFVECKRPFREESIRANVRGANHQLTGMLEKPGYESSFGVIAISADRFFMPPTQIATFSNPSAMPVIEHLEQSQVALGLKLQDLMYRNETHWLKHEFHPRVVAILFHICPTFVGPNGVGGGASVSLIHHLGGEGPAYICLNDAVMKVYQMQGQEL